MLQRLLLNDIGPFRSLDLGLASRCNVLTGDNGLGKTFVLELLWLGLGAGWRGYTVMPHAAVRANPAHPPTLAYQFKHGDHRSFQVDLHTRGLIQRIRAVGEDDPAAIRRRDYRSTGDGVVVFARVDGGFSVWDELRNGGVRSVPQGSESGERPGPLTYDFSPAEVWDGLEEKLDAGDKAKPRQLCDGLVRDWVSWQIRDNAQFKQLSVALARLSDDDVEPLRPGQPVREGLVETREVPTLALPYGEVPVTRASAGMKRVTALAYMLVWAWSEHRFMAERLGREPARQMTLLIDEVEAHLHPRWQRQILPALLAVCQELAPATTVQLFASTHAPLVMASLEPLFDPAVDAVFDFDLKGDEVCVTQLSWRRLGDADNWLTDLFDLAQPRSREAERAIEDATRELTRTDVTDDRVREIVARLGAVLPDTDPIFARWSWYAEKKGITL